MKQPKLYYFMNGGHHNLISKIDSNGYGIFDFSTNRFTDERWETLEEAIEGCKKYYTRLSIFNTYLELFLHISESENNYNIMDLFGDKYLIERESLHNDKVEGIRNKFNNK